MEHRGYLLDGEVPFCELINLQKRPIYFSQILLPVVEEFLHREMQGNVEIDILYFFLLNTDSLFELREESASVELLAEGEQRFEFGFDGFQLNVCGSIGFLSELGFIELRQHMEEKVLDIDIESVGVGIVDFEVRVDSHDIEHSGEGFCFEPELGVVFDGDEELEEFEFGESSHVVLSDEEHDEEFVHGDGVSDQPGEDLFFVVDSLAVDFVD